MITPGLYEHFKGGLYQVISVARHSENEQLMVVYRALYGELGLWVRPISMFSEQVQHNGERRPRFKRLEHQSGVLEVAYLDIKPERLDAFEAAMEQANPLIEASEGYISHHIKPCVENPNRYLLMVEWVSIEHHNDGFKSSDRYQQWKQLLHDFYDPFPEVWHFSQI